MIQKIAEKIKFCDFVSEDLYTPAYVLYNYVRDVDNVQFKVFTTEDVCETENR